jgi:hypothetical protein
VALSTTNPSAAATTQRSDHPLLIVDQQYPHTPYQPERAAAGHSTDRALASDGVKHSVLTVSNGNNWHMRIFDSNERCAYWRR